MRACDQPWAVHHATLAIEKTSELAARYRRGYDGHADVIVSKIADYDESARQFIYTHRRTTP